MIGYVNLNLINISYHLPTSDFVELITPYSFFLHKPMRLTESSVTHIDNISCNSIDKSPNHSETNTILKSCSFFLEYWFNKNCSELGNESGFFPVIHLNVRSISKNFSNFLTSLKIVEIQFLGIGLSETWPNDKKLKWYGSNRYS